MTVRQSVSQSQQSQRAARRSGESGLLVLIIKGVESSRVVEVAVTHPLHCLAHSLTQRIQAFKHPSRGQKSNQTVMYKKRKEKSVGRVRAEWPFRRYLCTSGLQACKGKKRAPSQRHFHGADDFCARRWLTD